jgi:hypothetical protein
MSSLIKKIYITKETTVMKKLLLTIGLLLTTSLQATQYDPKAVMCEHDMDKTITLSQELQKAILDNDKSRTDALMYVLHETTQSLKANCENKKM